MDENIIKNLKSESRWLRLVFMAVFALVGLVAVYFVLMLSVVQMLCGFIQGESNARLLQFTYGLNQFLYQIAQFLTYNSEDKPYPFSDWPEASDSEVVDEES